MSITDELKPCPFCGGDAEIYDFKDGRYLVECSNTSCDVYPCTSIHYDKEDAIAAWNRRADLARSIRWPCRRCDLVALFMPEDEPAEFTCSACGETASIDWETFYDIRFCPFCGRKVVSE